MIGQVAPFRPDAKIGLSGSLAIALAASLAVHVAVLPLWTGAVPPEPMPPLQVRLVDVPERKAQARRESAHPEPVRAPRRIQAAAPVPPVQEKLPTSMPAPSPPSAEEWARASTYSLRNSKRYRNAWGQQVRSQMGTAVAGPDQGLVRFRIEIAPDGRVAHVDELWSTSQKASKLAWQAIRTLPPLPPTPTGKSLVFEQTISFEPFETGWPPSYQMDCLPEPQPFTNPFVWDGASPQQVAAREHRPPPPEGCPPDSTAASIEEEEQSMQRQMAQWRWAR